MVKFTFFLTFEMAKFTFFDLSCMIMLFMVCIEPSMSVVSAQLEDSGHTNALEVSLRHGISSTGGSPPH